MLGFEGKWFWSGDPVAEFLATSIYQECGYGHAAWPGFLVDKLSVCIGHVRQLQTQVPPYFRKLRHLGEREINSSPVTPFCEQSCLTEDSPPDPPNHSPQGYTTTKWPRILELGEAKRGMVVSSSFFQTAFFLTPANAPRIRFDSSVRRVLRALSV